MNNHNELGYNPCPEIKLWRGTPIPPVLHPLAITPAREKIACNVWCMGPPWTVLRNAHVYLYHVLDFSTDDELHFTRRDVPESIWISAIKAAKKGDLSAGAYTVEGLHLGIFKPPYRCPWPTTANYHDFRCLANATREEIYELYDPRAPTVE